MPRITKYVNIPVLTSGTTQVQANDNNLYYRIHGTQTLINHWNVTLNGVAREGMECTFKYDADVTTAGFNIVVLGGVMPQNLSDKQCTISASYNGSAWVVIFKPDFEEDDIIIQARMSDDSVGTAEIIDRNVTLAKLSTITRGSVIYGAAGDVPAYLALGIATQILSSNGTDISWTAMSGDITISTGVTTIGATRVTNAMINTNVVGNGLTGGAGSPIAVLPDIVNGTSMVVSVNGLRLTNDVTAPGLTFYYGTNGAGTKGYYDLAALITGANTLQSSYNNGNTITVASVRPIVMTNSLSTASIVLDLRDASSGGYIVGRTTSGGVVAPVSTSVNISSTLISEGVTSGSLYNTRILNSENATDGSASILSYFGILQTHQVRGGSLVRAYINSSNLSIDGGTISSASSYTHYRASDESSLNINNANANIYGFFYNGNSIHTNGNRYGVYLNIPTNVASGEAVGIYMNMGINHAAKFAFSFQGTEVGHIAVGNGGFDSNNVGTFTAEGYIKIKVGSDTRYIPYGTIV